MPIQADNTKPSNTVDFSGKILSTTGDAVPVVDSYGRDIVAKDPTAPVDATAETTQTETKEVPKNQEAEARKLFLQAQKAERKAKEMEKKAASNLARADAFDKAKSLAASGEDPTALLTAAGLDPIKFYQDMTTYALSDKNKQEDPVHKELREHKERLDKYSKDLEVQANTIKEKEEVAAHNTVISRDVIPLLNANPDKYETLLLEYGQNAAVEVYKAVWERYQETGEVIPFEQAADRMEDYWATQVKTGITNASKLKKFQNLFAQANSEPRYSNDHKETPNRSITLSNKLNTSPIPSSGKNKTLTRDERIEAILKKH